MTAQLLASLSPLVELFVKNNYLPFWWESLETGSFIGPFCLGCGDDYTTHAYSFLIIIIIIIKPCISPWQECEVDYGECQVRRSTTETEMRNRDVKTHTK